MKKLGLVSCQVKAHRYKKGIKGQRNIPNTLDRQFAVTEPNQTCVVMLLMFGLAISGCILLLL
tara:strand:+ start:7402 stop:7590 length:189 start_codon:yes stop_codon:yes gene_type:complete